MKNRTGTVEVSMELGTDDEDAIAASKGEEFEPLEQLVEEKPILERVEEEEQGEDPITKVWVSNQEGVEDAKLQRAETEYEYLK